MVWIINDAPNDQKTKNCALVSAAALYSHITGEITTSGKMMELLWLDLSTNEDTKARQAIKSAKAADEINQMPRAVWSWSQTKVIIKSKDKDLPDSLDSYMDAKANLRSDQKYDLFRSFAPLSGNPIGDFEKINSSLFEMVIHASEIAFNKANIAAQKPVSAKESIKAHQVISNLEEAAGSSGNCLFVLHSYALGHLIFGRTQKNTQQSSKKLNFRYFDYQMDQPNYNEMPFLGIQPSIGSANTDEYDLIMVSDRMPIDKGLPTEEFKGEVDRNFQEIAKQKNGEQPKDKYDVLVAETAAPLDGVPLNIPK